MSTTIEPRIAGIDRDRHYDDPTAVPVEHFGAFDEPPGISDDAREKIERHIDMEGPCIQ